MRPQLGLLVVEMEKLQLHALVQLHTTRHLMPYGSQDAHYKADLKNVKQCNVNYTSLGGRSLITLSVDEGRVREFLGRQQFHSEGRIRGYYFHNVIEM